MLIQENRRDKCLELEIEIKNMCRRKKKRTVRKMEGGNRAAELE
jgi:predicted GIY-YIG superfamily endonuclease